MKEFLYHYTTISNLALILKNRTLRLNSLVHMDDIQEMKSKDVQNFGKFVYVSSWTDKEQEIIPMWKMYTKPELGVRIGLPKNPFQIFDSQINKFRDPTDKEIKVSQAKETKGIFPIISMEEMLKKNCIISNMGLGKQLTKVEYTSDLEKLEPRIVIIDNREDNFIVSLGKLGGIKNEYWSFQQEWRYIIRIQPISIKNTLKNYNLEMKQFQERIVKGQADQALSYIDLHLSDWALNKMEIVLAPDMAEGNKVLVESFIRQYNPEAKVRKSSLAGLLK